MATKVNLRSSFDAQGNAMGGCCAGPTTEVIGASCLGVSGHRMQISQRVAAWNALPAQSPAFDPVIAALDQSTASLVAAPAAGTCSQALAEADGALDLLDALLDTTGV